MIERISPPDGSESNWTGSLVPRVTDAHPATIMAAHNATPKRMYISSPGAALQYGEGEIINNRG